MKLQDLTAGSVIKYTDIENPGVEYIVLNALVGMESYINIISKETNSIEAMHKLTDINGKRWEIVAKA
jgi:hypothetical protein